MTGLKPYWRTFKRNKMPEISLVDTRKIIEVIKNKYGADIGGYSQSSLGNKLDRILKINLLSNADELIKEIQNNQSFFEKFLFDLLYIQGELFRDPEFWINLRSYYLTFRQTPFSNLRVLIPTSTNYTELISMIIFLEETGLAKKSELYISRIAEYPLSKFFKPAISVKNIDMENINKVFQDLDRSKYFSYKSEEIIFNKDLFPKVSIIDQDFDFKLNNQKFNLILFRNVLINYNHSYQNKIIKNLLSGLEKDGLIAFGYRENISSFIQASDEISPLFPEDNIYIKK